eukprot:scaffold29_cov251-Pinguiococcus_pyrenoidosus.AAC.53
MGAPSWGRLQPMTQPLSFSTNHIEVELPTAPFATACVDAVSTTAPEANVARPLLRRRRGLRSSGSLGTGAGTRWAPAWTVVGPFLSLVLPRPASSSRGLWAR